MPFALNLALLFMLTGPPEPALVTQAVPRQLAPCPETPNCVTSQAAAGASHWLAPLKGAGGVAATMARLKAVLSKNARVRVTAEQRDYLKAEFHIPVLGYVDDVEFLWSEAEGVLHVRSASRIGRWDLGVNRRRVERIRAAMEKAGR